VALKWVNIERIRGIAVELRRRIRDLSYSPMKLFTPLLVFLACVGPNLGMAAVRNAVAAKPNVVLIICDDLNDYVETLGGHPQVRTPNIARLMRSGVSFRQAHTNIPICGSSRASMFTGIYPHNSGCYGFTKWDGYDVLKNSRTLMDQFRAYGYHTLGTGKLMHHLVPGEWDEYGHPADYGPFPWDGTALLAHPDVPAPFSAIGAVDGSFGPLVNLATRTSPSGAPLRWVTGPWGQRRDLRVDGPEDRDQTADEVNADWAVANLTRLARAEDAQPFFMGIGFIRPHTPLIVPSRFFDLFPLDTIELPAIRPGDINDTHARAVRPLPDGWEPGLPRSEDMGRRLFENLVASYADPEEGLRRFIQAYLASVASIDEQVGRVLDVIEQSPLRDTTIIVFTSDHGWGMGEKDYLYKNSLWQESTRVPLVIAAPGVARAGGTTDLPVSLIDLYPTLLDLCGVPADTMKNERGHRLDGFSLKPLLVDPAADSWAGPDSALTALYKWREFYVPSRESYALRARDWRYIRYENGQEELYHTINDPLEWTNLASDPVHAAQLKSFRSQLAARIPNPGIIPPQPNFVAKP
jgi:arylsulfatase A-like enzyme